MNQTNVLALISGLRLAIGFPIAHLNRRPVKGEWRVDERTTFMEYLCNERDYGGSEDSSGIVDGMPFLGYIFLLVKKIVKTNKHTSK